MEPDDDDHRRQPHWLVLLSVIAKVLAGLIPVITAATALLNALNGTAS